jgi:ATP synthase protein I
MSEKKPPPALRDLDAKLREARDRQERSQGKTRSRRAQDMSGVGLALRLGVDFVAGVVVGVGVGLLLDWWLGSSPLMLVLFFFLGAAAGTFNVVRTASGQGSAVGYRRSPEDETDAKGEKDGGNADKTTGPDDISPGKRGPENQGPGKRGPGKRG